MAFVTDRALQFFDSLRQASSVRDACALLETTLADLGITRYSLLELGIDAEIGNGAVTNFPDEWGKVYLTGKFEHHDPVHRKLLRTRKGFAWSTLKREGYLEGRARTIFCTGGEFGISDGYTYPIFAESGYTAVVSFATDKLEDDPTLGPSLHLISMYFHARYFELMHGEDGVLEIPELTLRELECLKWASAGLTDWQIAEKLGISAETVSSHLQSARRKLRATNRVHAVATAIRHHLIRV